MPFQKTVALDDFWVVFNVIFAKKSSRVMNMNHILKVS